MSAHPHAARLVAYPDPHRENGLIVHCRWCKIDHYHSLPYGHRAAHCSKPGSPYLETGYVLVPSKSTTPNPQAAWSCKRAGQLTVS
jgi:hypothetical protein